MAGVQIPRNRFSARRDVGSGRPTSKPGGRYLNVGAAAGDGTAFRVEWLRAAQLTLIGFSATREEPENVLASYQRVADLAMTGSLVLPTDTYLLQDATQAWEAQASSPGKKIVVTP
jgi:hypothetical protein